MKKIIVLVMLGISTWLTPVNAQQLLWQNDGKFNYPTHFSKTPNSPNQKPEIHPGYTGSLAHSADQNYKVGGLAWLPNGDMVLLECGQLYKVDGRVHIIKNADGPANQVTSKIILEGFWEPLGIQVIDGIIYVMDQHGLWKLEETGGVYAKTMVMKRPIPEKGINRLSPQAFTFEHHCKIRFMVTG